ncbi:MAG: ABC transporter permease, partial [Bacteroidales bacterium]
MFRNYIKIVTRNILRNKVFSIINILGLAIGLGCFILIFLWVKDETGYDRFHENSDRLFRLLQRDHADPEFVWTTTPTPLGPLLKEKLPEIEAYTRFWSAGGLVQYEDKKFFESDIKLVDPYFFNMFTFPVVQGDQEVPMPDLNSIILTESTAQKYFGDSNPIGKSLNILDTIDLTVTAVIGDPPKKSHLRFAMLIHINHVPMYRLTSWASDYPTYILLREGANADTVIRKVEQEWRALDPEGTKYSDLQTITEIYLNEFGKPGKIIPVYTFSVIAVLVLVIACINFMNLSTARSSKRAKEVGLRKIVGASRSHLIVQFLGESMIFSFFALLVAWILVELIRPAFNNLSGKEVEIAYTDPVLVLSVLLIVILTGLLSGSYPALILSSFKSVNVLKGEIKRHPGSKTLRNILIVFQFFISVVLIVCIAMIYKQLWYIQNKDLGLN